MTAEDLVRLRDIGPAAVSPEGESIAFEMQRGDPDRNAYCIGIFVMRFGKGTLPTQADAGGEYIKLRGEQFGMQNYANGAPAPTSVKWSPDGRWVAYLKNLDGSVQLWRARSDGSQALAVVATTVDIEDFAWTSRSDGLLFASRPGLKAFRKAVGEEAGRGYLYDDRFAPSVSNRPFPRSVPLEYQVAGLEDGSVRPASTAEAALIQSPPPAEHPNAEQWSRSMRGDLAWFDQTASPSEAGSLKASLGKRTFVCEASACRGAIRAIWWSRTSKAIRFMRREGWGNSWTVLYEWTPGRSAVRRILATDALIENCSPLSDDFLCAFEDATSPRRLVLIKTSDGAMTPVYDPNPEFQPIALQPAERLHWRNDRGLESFGDLVLPAGHRPGQMHPLIVVGYLSRGFLRGGIGDEYPIQLFAANGYAVLSFNRPKDAGSLIESHDQDALLTASFRDWADRRSVNSALERGINLAIEKGAVDPDHIGLTGLSDGAVTVQWALLNSDRYAAASTSSLASSTAFMALGGPARSTTFRRWGLPALTAFDGRSAWGALSIAENPRAVTTPLLVQASDEEYLYGLDSHQALTEIERPVELHVFPNEHHVKWQPTHRLAIYRRNLQWFDFWLRGIERTDPLDPAQYSRWRGLRSRSATVGK